MTRPPPPPGPDSGRDVGAPERGGHGRASCCVGTWVRRALVLVLVHVTLLWTASARAAPFDPAEADWDGTLELARLARAELGPSRVVTGAALDFRELRPEDGVLLLHPERSLAVEDLARFMRAGGRVILLDDYGRGEGLLAHFGMQRVPLPRHPENALRQNPSFALAEPAGAHPVVSDVARVVTNHATGLAHPDLSPVLKVRAKEGESDVVIAVAGAVGQGRFLAVGDPSIVMNAMLRYAGNKAFARGLVRYAVDDDAWGKRGGRLFIVAGDIDQRGSYGGGEDPAASAIRAVRDLLETIRRDGMPPALAYAMSIALGLTIVVWVGSRAGRLHRPITPRFTRRAPPAAQGGVAGHAAVIGAPQTSRVLAVLELKSALEEQLATRLGLDVVPTQAELLDEVARRGMLDAEGVRTLRRLLLRMSNVETMLVSQRKTGATSVHEKLQDKVQDRRVRDQEVLSMARTVSMLLARIEERIARA